MQQHLHVTDVKDRNYFNAIYFREPGEILFEIATDPPGFAHDESQATMGSQLMLPPQYEQYRDRLNAMLIPIEVRELDRVSSCFNRAFCCTIRAGAYACLRLFSLNSTERGLLEADSSDYDIDVWRE